MDEDSILKELDKEYASLFSRYTFSSEEDKSYIVRGLFKGKNKIDMSDVNLLKTMLRHTNAFNTIYSYIEYTELMLDYPNRKFPVYLDIYNYDNTLRKEYMEMEVKEDRIKNDNEIEISCIVVPIFIGMELSNIFTRLEDVLFESNKLDSEEEILTYYWGEICGIFYPHITNPSIDIEKNIAVRVDHSIEKDFRLSIGRYNLTNQGIVLYIGNNLFIETMDEEQVYLNKYEINLNNLGYQQNLISFINAYPELFNSENILKEKEYNTLKSERIKHYLLGG